MCNSIQYSVCPPFAAREIANEKYGIKNLTKVTERILVEMSKDTELLTNLITVSNNIRCYVVAVHLIKNVMYHGNVIILLQISLLRRTPSDRIHGDWFHARPHPGRPGGERRTHRILN